MAMKKVFISMLSALLVSMFAVGGSVFATSLYYYLNEEQFGEVITASRIIWFSITFILSFLFIFLGLGKKERQ